MKKFLINILLPVRSFIQFLIKPDYTRDYNLMPPYKHHFVLLYEERLLETSIDYAIKNFRQCQYFHFTPQIWDFTINRLHRKENTTKGQLFLEFGTWKGTSINYFSSRLQDRVFYGFDSFEGLKEDWTGFSLSEGHFDLKGNLPKVNANVKLVKGWFDATLPDFLKENAGTIGFLHIDCDTFESTNYVLNTLKDRIVSGTFILFDEYIGYPNWEFGEYKAFQEFVSANNIKYRYMAFSVKQVLITIE